MKALVLKRAMSKPMGEIIIRHALREDCAELVDLMRALAEFEGYIEHFHVTPSALSEKLFDQQQVSALVAVADKGLVGMLIYYPLPFTYDLKPWFYIKELFVKPAFRSQKIGLQLMRVLSEECDKLGGTKIRWDVLSSNENAQRFYQSLGAKHEIDWQLYSLSETAIARLSHSKS